MMGTVHASRKPEHAAHSEYNSRDYLQSLFENSRDAILVTNDEGRYIDANPAACAFLGYTHEELIQLSTSDLTAVHFRQEAWAMWQEFLMKGSQSGEYSVLRKDGRVIQFEFCAVANILPGIHVSSSRAITESKHASEAQPEISEKTLDQSVFLRGLMVDIAERMSADEKLRQSESQLAEAQRLARVGSWNVDLINNIHTWSDELYRIYGLHANESDASYDAFIELVHPDDRGAIGRVVDDALATQEPINCYVRIIPPDQAERIIHSRGTTICDFSGTPIRMHGTVQDVTESRQAEDALRRAEQKYRDIFENAREGIFQSTPDGRVLTANPALARMYGFSSGEEFIQSRTDISSQTYADPELRKEFERQLETNGMVRGFEHQVLRKDGSKIWISVNARIVRDDQGAIQYYEGTAQDITDRIQGEEALREGEERHRELFENAKDAIYVQDLQGFYSSVNRAAEKLSGYDRTEIIGKHFEHFVAPEDLPLVRMKRAKKLADNEQTAYEVRVLAKDGRRVPVELSSAVIFEGGVPVGIQGIARDITERKRAEDDLRQQQETLQKIFDYLPVMIRLVGPDGKVQLVNREYERTTGWSSEEIQQNQQNIFAELYPDKHIQQVILERIANAKGDWADFRTRVRDGRVIDTSWTNIHLSGGMSLGIGQDISERKRAEEALRSYSRKLIEAQEAERQHIARELHDQIGQVLTAIRINLQTIGNSVETGESQTLIDQGVAIIDSALEQVRNLSFELHPSLLDGLGLVAALRWYSDHYAQRTGIRTRTSTNLAEGQIRLKRELETACFRIVQEALTNVVRHARAKSVSINLRKRDHSIVLSIKDDGVGFDERATNGSPIHLGLRGMKERALALDGTLEIKSAPARGSEIRASFPTDSKED